MDSRGNRLDPNYFMTRKNAAGPKVLDTDTSGQKEEVEPSMLEKKSSSDELLAAKINKDKDKKEQQMKENIMVDGKIIIVSQIYAPKDVLCIRYTEEFDYIAAGYADGVIRMFKANNNEATFRLSDTEVSRAPVTSIEHRPVSKSYPISNTFTCTYANGCVKCWNYNFNQCIYTIREKRQTFGLTYHPRLPKFVTYGDDENIYMYDEETKTQERILRRSENPERHDGHTSRVFAGCFNPRSNHELITGGWDNVVQFWDLRQPHAIRHISGVHMCGEGIDITQKGNEILTCAWQKGNSVQIWDYASGKLLASPEPDLFQSKLYCGKYVTKDYIVCGGTDINILRIVDGNTFSTKAHLLNLPGGVLSIDIGPSVKLKKKDDRVTKNDLVGLPKLAFVSGRGMFQIEPVT